MKKFLSVLFILFLFCVQGFAQEGMWLLNQLNQLDLNKKGLQISTEDIYSKDNTGLYQAVVQLGGGTASFVSGNGLLVTNHHVAYTALQRASSKENDLITNGFLAKTKSEEIKAAGYQARLLVEMRDVTDEIISSVAGVSDAVEKITKINLRYRNFLLPLQIIHPKRRYRKQNILYLRSTLLEVRCAVGILELLFYLN